MEYLPFLPRLIVGLFLVISAMAKLRSDATLFVAMILALDVVPRTLAHPIAKLLPWAELVVGATILLGVQSTFSAAAAFVLIAILTSAIVLALSKGKRVFCACLGFTATQVAQSQWTMVYRNLVLLCGCLVMVRYPGAYRVDGWWPSAAIVVPPFVVLLLLSGLAAIGLVVVVLRFRWSETEERGAPSAAPVLEASVS